MNVATIMTERLILKELEFEDATLLISKIYTEDNTKYLTSLFNPTLEEVIGFLGEIVSENKKTNARKLAFGIHSNDVLVGVIQLEKQKNDYEIEFIMDPMYQLLGFTYEACIVIIDYVRRGNGRKIIGKVDVKNIAGINLLEKLGMKRINIVNQRVYPNKEKSFELSYELEL